MNAEREYFCKLYTNKDKWATYSKREVGIMIRGFESLMESANLPLSNATTARMYKLPVEEIINVQQNGKEILAEMQSLGIADKKELGRLRSVLDGNMTLILHKRQDGIDEQAIFASLEVPFDKKLWHELIEAFKVRHVDITSDRDILHLASRLKASQTKDIDHIINSYPLFSSKKEVINALKRNSYDLKKYLNAEDYYTYVESKKVVDDTKLHVGF